MLPFYLCDWSRLIPFHVHRSSPESLHSAGGIQGDIWSAGVLLYHLLSGQYPFCDPRHKISQGEYWRRVAEAPISTSGPAWQGVPPCAVALVRSMLDRDCSRWGPRSRESEEQQAVTLCVQTMAERMDRRERDGDELRCMHRRGITSGRQHPFLPASLTLSATPFSMCIAAALLQSRLCVTSGYWT